MKSEKSKTQKNPSPPRLRAWLVLLLAGTILGIVFRDEILALPAWALVRDDGKPKSIETIIVLMGDSSSRRAKATLDLWRKNKTAHIIIMKEKPEGFVSLGLAPGRDDLHMEYFLQAGVPATSLIPIKTCLTASTADEARCFLTNQEALSLHTQELVIVTDWYHTSRAGYLFEHILKGTGLHVSIIPAAVHDPLKGVHSWWRDEEMLLRVFEEYLKWMYWRIKHLVA